MTDKHKFLTSLPDELLNSLLDSAASALVLVKQNGSIIYANAALEDIFGFKPDDVIGKHLNRLLVPTTRQKHAEHLNHFFKHSVNRNMGGGDSFPAQHKSGKTIYISIGLRTFEYVDEKCVLATITPAQKLYAANTSLAESKLILAKSITENKRLLEASEGSSDAVFIIDTEGKLTWGNRTANSMMNKSTSDIIGMDLVRLINEKSLLVERRKLKDALCNGLSYSGDLVLNHAKDKTLQVSVNLQPVFNLELLQGFSFTAKDVTGRRLLEAQMRENSELLVTTARMAKLGFYSIDIESNTLTWSEEVYNIHELPVNSKVNVEDAIKYYAPECQDEITSAVERCMSTGESFDLELPFITAKNRRIWVRAVGYAEFRNGKPIKLKGAFQDISHLRQAALEAEEAAQVKSNFLANISHELRTPISGIMGIVELLEGSSLSKKQSEYTAMIGTSANSLLFLVNQVLDYAKLNSNLQTLNKSIFDLHQLVKDKTYIHALAADNKNLSFTLSINDDVPISYYTDSNRLGQVINNLCSNAIKFTESGSIKVALSMLDNDKLEFSVCDTGLGIKEEDISKLFNEFQQLNNTFSRTHEGTGLGLTISKQLVTLLDGEMRVESEYGKGSRFAFTIPNQKLSQDSLLLLDGVSLPNTLVLSKNEAVSGIWNEIANAQKIKLLATTDIAQLIQALKTDKHWELVVVLDSPDNVPPATCVKSIMRLLGTHKGLVLNSNKFSPDLVESIIGAAHVPTINLASLSLTIGGKEMNLHAKSCWQIAVLQRWYASNKKHYVKSYDLTNKHIVIAEDNSINQVLFKEMLQSSNAKVDIVDNGKELLAYLETTQDIDLIIMDCQMPLLDGFEATKAIRAHQSKKISDIRIVAATAHGFEEDIQSCYKVGMNDVLIKPFSNQQLLDMIHRNL